MSNGAGNRVWPPAAETGSFSQSGAGPNAVVSGPPRTRAAEPPASPRRILVVEDEDAVRTLVCRILRRQGYIVLEAADANEALRVLDGADDGIELLITDMMMPGMTGADLAERVAEQRPKLRVLYISGHPEDALREHGISPDADFLGKPFSPDALIAKVAELLAV